MSSSSDGATWTCGRCGRVSDLLVVRCPRCGFQNPIALVEDYSSDSHSSTHDHPHDVGHGSTGSSSPSDTGGGRAGATATQTHFDISRAFLAVVVLLLIGTIVAIVVCFNNLAQLRTATKSAAQYRADCNTTAQAMAQEQAAGTPMTSPDPSLACRYWSVTASLRPADSEGRQYIFDITPDNGPSYEVDVTAPSTLPASRVGTAMAEEWDHQTTAIIFDDVRFPTSNNPIYTADVDGRMVRSSRGVAITTTVFLILAIVGYTVGLYRQENN